MESFKEYLKSKLNGSKKTENLVVLIILCVILLLAINYIFNDENKKTKEVVSENVSTNITEKKLSERLEETLNAIKGVKNAKVVISYSSTETINPVYDVKENIDIQNSGDKKTTTEKTVAYEESDGDKVAIVASKNLARAEGAVIVFDGDGNLETVAKVKEAAAIAIGVAIHKIQVFQN